MKELIILSNGNPGALECLTGLMTGKQEDSVAGLTIIPFIQENRISGTDIYVFWSDLANKDYQLMSYLCKECPKEILIDASSRQDRSGTELVKEYVDNYNKQAA